MTKKRSATQAPEAIEAKHPVEQPSQEEQALIDKYGAEDGEPIPDKDPDNAWDAMKQYNTAQGHDPDPFNMVPGAAGGVLFDEDAPISQSARIASTDLNLPVGTYDGRVLSFRPTGKTSASGLRGFVFNFEVLEGEHVGRQQAFFVYDDRGWFRAQQVFDSIDLDPNTCSAKDIKNRAITWTMKEDNYNGQTRTQVDIVVPPRHHPIGTVVEDQVPF